MHACRNVIYIIGCIVIYYTWLVCINAARRIRTGSQEELLDLTDREAENPYAHLEGSLVLVPKCSRNEAHWNETVFEAYLRNVKITCLNENAGAAHFDECRSNFGPPESVFKPCFVYAVIADHRV